MNPRKVLMTALVVAAILAAAYGAGWLIAGAIDSTTGMTE